MKSSVIAHALAVGLCLTTAAAQAQLDTPQPDVPPAQTAPEAQIDKSWMDFKDPYVQEQSKLSNPHRSTEEVVTWAQNIATEALTLSPETMNTHLTSLRPFFSEKGWLEYGTYMRDQRVLDMVSVKKYFLTTILDGDGIITNSGALTGSYRWVLSVPLIITFHSESEDGQERRPVAGGTFRLDLQVARVAQDQGRDGMVVESWKVTQVTKPR